MSTTSTYYDPTRFFAHYTAPLPYMNGSPNSVDALPWPVRRLLDLQEARLPAWMKSEVRTCGFAFLARDNKASRICPPTTSIRENTTWLMSHLPMLPYLRPTSNSVSRSSGCCEICLRLSCDRPWQYVEGTITNTAMRRSCSRRFL